MPKNRDDELNSKRGSGDFSLEEILVEYGEDKKVVPFPGTHMGGGVNAAPPAVDEEEDAPPPPPAAAPSPQGEEKKRKGSKEKVVEFPGTDDEDDDTGSPAHPGTTDALGRGGARERSKPWPLGRGEQSGLCDDEVDEPTSPLQLGFEKLRKKADEYAEHMFEEEGVEDDENVQRAEKYLPGVDVEEHEEDAPLRARKPRRENAPAPDLPPQELYRRYNKGLSFLRFRAILVFVVALALLYPTLAPFFHWPLPGLLGASYSIRVYTLAGLLGAAMLLGIDVFLMGILHIVHSGFGMDTLVSLSCVATLADALTIQSLGGRGEQLPYCAISAFALAITMWGRYLQRRGSRSACRTAAAASQPYLVALDESRWNGRDAYSKWSGEPIGFGSQMQSADGAQRIFRVVAPLLFIACTLLSMVASLGQQRPELILWCFSSTLTASASFSSLLCFGMPWSRLSLRLSKCGAALAGWDGVASSSGSAGILLTDADLFPPGSVALNGIKVFGDFSVEKVVACTATLVRDSAGGLDKVFHDLLRSQGAVYRRCEAFAVYEGGLTAVVRNDQVLVGSSSFMHLMEIPLPQGLNVKNAVFCAINGELAGVFALNYSLHSAVSPSITALTRNRVNPVLATRDFNIIPAMLRQRFKLPVERMEFPPVERRSELSDPDASHSEMLTAVLCREGLFPFSEAVVGGKRLKVAVTLNALLAALGSAVGVLMAFYLSFAGSFSSLSPANLLIFMFAWLVPTLLISGWVDRY